MKDHEERFVAVNGEPCRVWEKGSGAPLVYLAGLGGLPRWTPVLERLADSRRVIAPSLPGFPGATGHDQLDSPLDWITATLDLLDAAAPPVSDLVGVSVGATLAAEVAALVPTRVRRLVLSAPFGLFEESEPVADVWAHPPGAASQAWVSNPERWGDIARAPENADPVEWPILQTRAQEAAARLLWPTTDTGLRKRLHRIHCDTLVVWGADDRIVPVSYAKHFAQAISGRSELLCLPAAGHLADVDAPDAFAAALLDFLERS